MTVEISRYKVTVHHDDGIVTITVVASSENAAINAVMEAERCPRSSIRKVEKLKVLYRGAEV